MSQYLPRVRFKRVTQDKSYEVDKNAILKETPEGCILEVDLEYQDFRFCQHLINIKIEMVIVFIEFMSDTESLYKMSSVN